MTIYINGSPIHKATEFNIKDVTIPDSMALSKGVSGSITVEMPEDMQRQWQMHQHQKKHGIPKRVYIPGPYGID